MVPDLLSQISDLLNGRPGLPTPVVAPSPGPISAPAPAPTGGAPDLVAQLSSLLASLTAGKPPMPTAPGVVIPSIPAQGIPSRSCDNGPGFLTSVITAIPSAAAGVPAGSVPVPVPVSAVEPVAPPFNPRSASNVAAYYGQPGSDGTKSLLETCADPNVDILILGFLTDVTYGGSIYPRLQLVCPPFSPLPRPQTPLLTNPSRARPSPASKPPQ